MKYTHKLDNIGLPNFELQVYSVKDNATIRTVATVHKKDGSFNTHRIYTDYSKVIERTPCTRVTVKALDNAQCKALQSLGAIVEDVKAHYITLGEIAKPD